MAEPPSLDEFLRGEIDNRTFRHVDHVRMGFELLRLHEFSTASHTFSAALKTIAARAGNPGAYHETITTAFMALIAERSAPGFDKFEDFVSSNSDVMSKSILEQWYAPERLRSDLARRVLILPEPMRERRRQGAGAPPKWSSSFVRCSAMSSARDIARVG